MIELSMSFWRSLEFGARKATECSESNEMLGKNKVTLRWTIGVQAQLYYGNYTNKQAVIHSVQQQSTRLH